MNLLENEKSFKCKECPSVFSARPNLAKHVKNCHGESHRNIYKCDICDQTRTTADQLRTHKLEVHNKKKNHYCTFCIIKVFIWNFGLIVVTCVKRLSSQ